jgi:hypothetical protein
MDALDLMRRHEVMASERSTWESHWQEIAERVIPRQDNFFGVHRTQGDKRTDKIFDSTAVRALERFAAAIESILTPRNEKWHKLVPEDPSLKEDQETKTWLDEVNDQLFRQRYSPRSNFASQAHEFYMSLGAFGTAVMFVDDDLKSRALRYQTLHLGEVFIGTNNRGVVDVVHRAFELTARQAAQEWGLESLPDRIRADAQHKPTTTYRFLHCVYPNDELNPSRSDYKGMAFASTYLSVDFRAVLEKGGYHTFPYLVGRYTKAPGETYGRSPAMDALADIKMLNEMEKTTLRAAHLAVNPPLLTADDGVLGAFQIRPSVVIPGGLSETGSERIKALESRANIPLSVEMSNQRRSSIQDHFLVSLFMILAEDRSNMTATEVLQRAQEKGILLAPAAGRQHAEFLGPLIQRELDLIARAGALPPPPDTFGQSGAGYAIEYTSELSRAQRAGEGVGILRTIEALAPLAQIDPGVLDVLDPDEMARTLAEINGVPPRAIRSPEDVAALKDQRAQAQQAQQALAAAPVAAGAAKDLAQAQAMAGVPGSELLGAG